MHVLQSLLAISSSSVHVRLPLLEKRCGTRLSVLNINQQNPTTRAMQMQTYAIMLLGPISYSDPTIKIMSNVFNLKQSNKRKLLQMSLIHSHGILTSIINRTLTSFLYLKNVGSMWLDYLMEYSVSHPTVGVRKCKHMQHMRET